MEDVAVYGYITPLKVKIVIALPLSDSVVRDAETTMVRSFWLPQVQSWHTKFNQIFKALHLAYYSSISNPFLKLNESGDSNNDHSSLLAVGSAKWKGFAQRIDDISSVVGQTINPATNS